MLTVFLAGAWIGALIGLGVGASLAGPAGYNRGRRYRQRRHSGGQVILANAPRPQVQAHVPKPPPR